MVWVAGAVTAVGAYNSRCLVDGDIGKDGRLQDGRRWRRRVWDAGLGSRANCPQVALLLLQTRLATSFAHSRVAMSRLGLPVELGFGGFGHGSHSRLLSLRSCLPRGSPPLTTTHCTPHAITQPSTQTYFLPHTHLSLSNTHITTATMSGKLYTYAPL